MTDRTLQEEEKKEYVEELPCTPVKKGLKNDTQFDHSGVVRRSLMMESQQDLTVFAEDTIVSEQPTEVNVEPSFIQELNLRHTPQRNNRNKSQLQYTDHQRTKKKKVRIASINLEQIQFIKKSIITSPVSKNTYYSFVNDSQTNPFQISSKKLEKKAAMKKLKKG